MSAKQSRAIKSYGSFVARYCVWNSKMSSQWNFCYNLHNYCPRNCKYFNKNSFKRCAYARRAVCWHVWSMFGMNTHSFLVYFIQQTYCNLWWFITKTLFFILVHRLQLNVLICTSSETNTDLNYCKI